MASARDLDDALLVQAADWYALTLGDEISSADLEALDRWLEADPRHERAFALTARTASQLEQGALLGQLASLKDGASLASHGAASTIAQTGSGESRRAGMTPANDEGGDPRAHRWRALIAGPALRWAVPTALAASLALAVGFGSFSAAPTGQPVATAIAQTRVLTLADGSRVTLGPASRIATSVNERERRVTLLAGEAFFEVTHDGRPFWVNAGDARIQVVGTKFDVNRASGRVQVSVLDGVVKVHEPSPIFAKAPIQTLRASQRIEIRDSTDAVFSAAAAAPVMADPVPAGEWRSGRRTYLDARLGDVVDDLNRYYGPGISLSDPALADVRIAMELRATDVDAFFDSLPLVAPVRVDRDRAGKVTLESTR